MFRQNNKICHDAFTDQLQSMVKISWTSVEILSTTTKWKTTVQNFGHIFSASATSK